MSKKSRDKGIRGERLVIDWLQPIVDEVVNDLGLKSVSLQRNTIQSDKGGSDLHGLQWLAAEVKNCEADGPAAIDDWWEQCRAQAEEWSTERQPLTPVLFYTRAHRPIRVRMFGWLACGHAKGIFAGAVCDVSAEQFEAYFKLRLKYEFTK